MSIALFLALHHFLSLFVQTFFHHRYSAHQMFSMSRFWEKVFFISSWLFQGSSYLSPFTYGKMHRMHHAYADTEKDVHSPKYDHSLWKMMKRTAIIFGGIESGKFKVQQKFTQNLPQWDAFDRFAYIWPVRIFWGVLYTLFYLYFASQWWMFLLLPLHFIMSPIHGAIINWFAHKIGYRNHHTKDTSTNLFPIEILMLGEGLHNNHHSKSTRPNFAQKWFEFDPVYWVILVFNGLGIVQLKKA